MRHIFNRISEKDNRRRLRQEATPAEKILWAQLRRNKLGDLKFKRQYSVQKYVLDFYCPFRKLAVELDGEVHLDNDVKAHDLERDKYLRRIGIKVIRIKNEEVYCNLEYVLNLIKKEAEI